MRKNKILPLVLAGSLVGMGAWIYLMEQGDDTPAEEGGEGRIPLFTLSSEDAQSLKIQNKNGTFVIQRVGDGWRLTDPIQAEAEASIVTAILNSIEEARSERVLPDAAGRLKAFDLERPAASLTLTGKDAEETLYIGGPGPFGGQYYVRQGEGTDVLLTADALQSYLGGTLLEYRAKRLIDFSLPEVESLDLEGARIPPITLTRRGRDYYAASGDGAFRLDKTQVEDILADLKTLEAVDFRPGPMASPEGDRPLLKVTLKVKDRDEPYVITFQSMLPPETGGEESPTPGGAEGAPVIAWIAGEEEGRVLPEEGLTPFQVTLDLLRDRAPLSFQRWLVDRVEIKAGSQTYKATKEGFEWKVEPEGGGLEAREVGQLLDGLENTEALRFIDRPEALSTYGLDAPQLAITVAYSKEGGPATLLLAQEGAHLYGKTDGEAPVYVLDPALYLELMGLLETAPEAD